MFEKLRRGCYNKTLNFSGSSSAWLEHLLWEQGAAGSNPSSPTNFSDKEKFVGTQASVKRPDKGRSERSADKASRPKRRPTRFEYFDYGFHPASPG
jgi:hypothetical protein